MEADVETGPSFSAGTPRELFFGPYDFNQIKNWDVGPDGSFVMVESDPAFGREIRVVLNWFSELSDE